MIIYKYTPRLFIFYILFKGKIFTIDNVQIKNKTLG